MELVEGEASYEQKERGCWSRQSQDTWKETGSEALSTNIRLWEMLKLLALHKDAYSVADDTGMMGNYHGS